MNILPRATLAVLVLAANSAANAQTSVDSAHATLNRLLDGAGDSLVFDTGRVLDTDHGTISNVRTAGRCRTTYAMTFPSSPDIPQQYHGRYDSGGEVQWDKVTSPRLAGERFYYDHPRARTGEKVTYHWQFGSTGEAREFAEAAETIIRACAAGEEDDNGPAEEVVHDPRGNVASLAIDRRDGSRYGWAIDYETVDAADRRALGECQRDGSNCHVVLRFTGGCGAYAADSSNGSTAYGWGTARTRPEAESRAHSEARQRGASNVATRVWGCNSVKAAAAVGSSAASQPTAAQEAREERDRAFQEELRKHEEALRANDEAVKQYKAQLQANDKMLKEAAELAKTAQSQYDAELAKARASQEQYARDRQAYREEYKKATGRYPDE